MSSISSLPLTLLLLLATCSLTLTNSENICLYNREDVLPCMDYENKGVLSPGENQYTIHATRLQRGRNADFVCVKRKEDEIIRDIEDLGVPEVKFLYSPGAELLPPVNYPNQILVEYNVKCEAGLSAYINFNALDLEPKNCFDKAISGHRCQDYVEINAGQGGVREFCGNVLPQRPIVVHSGKFTLKMRSSFYDTYPGFRAFVTCFRNDPSEMTSVRCTSSQMPQGFEVVVSRRSALLRLDKRLTSDANPVTVTEMERIIINTLSESLFNKSFDEARQRKSSEEWPPASYFQDNPGDIIDLNELSPDTDDSVRTITLPRAQPVEIGKRKRRWSSRYRRTEGAQMNEENVKALAVMNENACNPIVRMTARCYLTIVRAFEA